MEQLLYFSCGWKTIKFEEDTKFFLTYRPEDIPPDWNDWAICSHSHNNNLQEYPFIDGENKRINVSIELTKYKPVDMDFLIKQINEWFLSNGIF